MVVAATLVLLATGQLLSRSPLVIGLQVLALAVMAWARLSLAGAFAVTAEPRGEALVEVGPYRWVRHPQFAGALLLIGSAVLSHISWLSLGTGLAVAGLVAVRIACEERLLRARFADYAAYAARTRRLVPLIL